jgi:hypothetical protein
MRRLWAAAAAIVVCVALDGLPVLAQEPGVAVAVTATQVCSGGPHPWGACAHNASDPRVSGALTIADQGGVTLPRTAVPRLEWWQATLQGPDGPWRGHVYIVREKQSLWGPSVHALMMLSGTGPYEGWTYVASGLDPAGVGDYVGVLYPGPLPPCGPPEPPEDE